MADDPFNDLLQLEDEFYKEGYDAGVVDSAYAGMIEGKVFGIEKGYEKALELARIHGRALVWQTRTSTKDDKAEKNDAAMQQSTKISRQCQELETLPRNSRLAKHIENLLALTASDTLATDNSDTAVTDFDERISKAQAKAKVVANIIGETLSAPKLANSGIEDATGLNARR